MKASDPGAWEYSAYLNGERLEHCFEADEEAGTALIAEIDYRTGKRILDFDSPLGWRTLEVRGKVELRRKA